MVVAGVFDSDISVTGVFVAGVCVVGVFVAGVVVGWVLLLFNSNLLDLLSSNASPFKISSIWASSSVS